MPPVLTWLGTFAAGVGSAVTGATAGYLGATAAVALGAVVEGVIYYGVIIGASVAYSSAQQRKLKKALGASQAQSSINQGRNIMVRDPVSPWRLIYGQIPVSGPIFFWEVSGTNNEYLNLAITLAHHECEELGTIRFDGVEIPLDGSGNATGTYAGYVRIKKFLGLAAGERDTTWEAELPGVWTATMLGKHVARLHVQLKHNPDLFVNGLPTITCLVKGKKVYDFRTATTAWSDNAILIKADFLMDTNWGKGIALARIRSAIASSEANICDETVVLADASTEKRYTINGAVTSDQDPDGILLDLCAADAGHVCDAGGLWTLRCGAWRAPTLSLGEGDMCGSFTMVPRQSRQDTYNGVKGTYIAAINQWAPADFPAIIKSVVATAITPGSRCTILSLGTTDFTLIGAASNTVGVTFTATDVGTGTGTVDPYRGNDGGLRLWKDVVYNFTTSPSMCQRLAKIDLEAGRQQIIITGDFMLKAMQCQPGDVIEFTRARLGWSAKHFEVEKWEFKFIQAGGGPALAIALTGRETAEGVYDWANGEETTVDLAANTTMVDPRTVATPGTLTLTTSNFQQQDGAITPRLKVAWTAPADVKITSGGYVHLEYKKTADADWNVWTNKLRGDATFDFITDVLAGVSYDVRARFENINRVRGLYGTTASATVSTDATAPATPTGLLALAGPGCVILDWTDNAETDFAFYELYRHTADVFASAVLAWSGRASQYSDYGADIGGLVVSTPYYYWLKAVDRTNNKSSQTTSVNAAPNSTTGATGAAGADGLNIATAFLYKRAASAPAVPAGTLTYTFATGVLSGTLDGWTQTVPADDGNACYVTLATASSAAATDGIATGEWATPTILTQSGLQAATAFLYKRAASAPAVPAGTLTYTFATGALSGTLDGWTQAVPAVNGNPCYVTQATALASAVTTTDDIATGEWSSPLLFVQDGATGATGAPGLNNAIAQLFQRAASSPSVPAGTLTYTFATGVLSGTLGSWTQTVPADNGNPLYVITAVASSAGADDTIATGEWATPTVITLSGIQTAPVFLYKRAASAPAVPAGTLTYTFATGALSGTLDGWTQTVPAVNGNPCYVAQASALASATATTDDIATGEWSTPAILVQDGATGAKGDTGDAGAAAPATQFEYSVDGSTSWHSTWAAGDLYVRSSVNGGSSWSAAQRFVGPAGADAAPLTDTPTHSLDPASFTSSSSTSTLTVNCETGATVFILYKGQTYTRSNGGTLSVTKLIGFVFWAEKSGEQASASVYDMYEDNT